jgi:hypothetical protein
MRGHVHGSLDSGVPDGTSPGANRGSGHVRSLVLRAWLEDEVPHLRVRVLEIAPGGNDQPVLVTTSVDEVCRAVQNWLEGLQAGGIGNGDGTVTHRP